MIIMPDSRPRPIAAAHRPGRLLAPHRPSGVGENRVIKVRAAEVRAAKVRTVEDRAGQVRAGEVRAGEDRAGEDRAAEDRVGEVRAIEDRAAWRYAEPADPGFTWDNRNGYQADSMIPDSRIALLRRWAGDSMS